MYPIIIIAGRTIGTYALCGLLGLLAAGWMAVRLGKWESLEPEDTILLILVIVVGLLIGGHALYGLTNLHLLADIIRQRANLSQKELLYSVYHCFNGMVYYGGFIGGYIALRFFQNCTPSLREKRLTDIYAVCTPLFHAFARIGCFFGGCCYGVPSSIGFLVENNPLSPAINGVKRFPTPLLEAAFNFVIFVLLRRWYQSGKYKGKEIRQYLLLYAPLRFFIEFLRGDEIRGFWWILSTSQWISLLLFLVAVISIYRNRRTE